MMSILLLIKRKSIKKTYHNRCFEQSSVHNITIMGFLSAEKILKLRNS